MSDGRLPGARLSRDTTREAEERQIAAWRAMSSIQIATLVDSASRAARELALAGLRSRHPEANSREIVARFAVLTLGRDLARRAYPEIDDLAP